jgi:hypothetical protein
LHPRLDQAELVRETVLVEAGGPLTQRDLDRRLYAVRSGIVRYSRGHIEITDLEGLRATCCECYQAVKAQRVRLLKVPDGISAADGG